MCFTMIMQNKPNLKDTQMNVYLYNTKDYENIANRTLGQNKPNQSQLKPILSAVGGLQMNLTSPAGISLIFLKNGIRIPGNKNKDF